MTPLQAILFRRSVRAYSSRPIPPDVMQRLRDAIRSAPSACNIQPWHFIFVTDPQLRIALAHAAKGQMFIADAPVIIVACGMVSQAYPRMGGRYSSLDMDLAIALDHLMLAAVEESLGTCWIGAFSEDQVKPILAIPDNARVVAMTPVGYPTSDTLIHPLDPTQRKRESEIFSVNRF